MAVPNLDIKDFYFVESIYPYNSNNTEYNKEIFPDCIAIPEFEIKNLNLLANLDYNLINSKRISILKISNSICYIDLHYYEIENSNLQS
jgi:hypothetical protein